MLKNLYSEEKKRLISWWSLFSKRFFNPSVECGVRKATYSLASFLVAAWGCCLFDDLHQWCQQYQAKKLSVKTSYHLKARLFFRAFVFPVKSSVVCVLCQFFVGFFLSPPSFHRVADLAVWLLFGSSLFSLVNMQLSIHQWQLHVHVLYSDSEAFSIILPDLTRSTLMVFKATPFDMFTESVLCTGCLVMHFLQRPQLFTSMRCCRLVSLFFHLLNIFCVRLSLVFQSSALNVFWESRHHTWTCWVDQMGWWMCTVWSL